MPGNCRHCFTISLLTLRSLTGPCSDDRCSRVVQECRGTIRKVNGIFLCLSLSSGGESVERASNERGTDKAVPRRTADGDWTDKRCRSTRGIDLVQSIRHRRTATRTTVTNCVVQSVRRSGETRFEAAAAGNGDTGAAGADQCGCPGPEVNGVQIPRNRIDSEIGAVGQSSSGRLIGNGSVSNESRRPGGWSYLQQLVRPVVRVSLKARCQVDSGAARQSGCANMGESP